VDAPTQIVALPVIDAVGSGMTVTVVLPVSETAGQPLPVIDVIVNVAVDAGVTVFEIGDEFPLKAPPPLLSVPLNGADPVTTILRFTDWPAQMFVLDVVN